MAQRQPTGKIRPVSHNFYIPEGLDAYQYPEIDLIGEDVNDTVTTDSLETVEWDDVESSGTPTIIGIYEQRIRTAPDGSQVVDVTFEVDGGDEVSEYDIRVTKL